MDQTDNNMRQTLDLKGLKCPLPALKTSKLLTQMAAGEEVEVISTDPMAQIDIPHLVQSTGNELVTQSNTAEQFTFLIRKS